MNKNAVTAAASLVVESKALHTTVPHLAISRAYPYLERIHLTRAMEFRNELQTLLGKGFRVAVSPDTPYKIVATRVVPVNGMGGRHTIAVHAHRLFMQILGTATKAELNALTITPTTKAASAAITGLRAIAGGR